jgi:hypothetical protein
MPNIIRAVAAFGAAIVVPYPCGFSGLDRTILKKIPEEIAGRLIGQFKYLAQFKYLLFQKF